MHNKIYLTGFMGSGKSRIGKLLASELEVDFIDTDDKIESIYNKTIAQMFDEIGEKEFRNIESNYICELIKSDKNRVVSLGGGSLINKMVLNMIIESGLLIYIKSSLEEIWQRTKNKTKRPLLLINGKFPSKKEFIIKSEILMQEREQGYNKAHLVVDRVGKEAEEVVNEILDNIKI